MPPTAKGGALEGTANKDQLNALTLKISTSLINNTSNKADFTKTNKSL